MNLRQIEYVVAVAEESSFTLAAKRCHTVQSALSHQIAKLEEELGVSLFERTSRKVILTLAGQSFVEQAKHTLDSVQKIYTDVTATTGLVSGRLNVGMISAMTMINIVDVFAEFHQNYPEVDIGLKTAGSEILINDVANHRLDIALIGLWVDEPISGVEYSQLAEEPLVAVLPCDHHLAKYPLLSLHQLAAEPMVNYPKESSARRQTDEAFASQGLLSKVKFVVDHISLIEQLVASGLAYAIVPKPLAEEFSDVVAIPIKEAPKRALYMIWSSRPSPAAKAFMSLIQT